MSLLTSLNSQFEPQAAEKHLDFIINVDESCPQFLFADSFRLEQIIANLLSNGIKFTEQGEVCLSVHMTAAANQMKQLVINVSDTGIGMDSQFVSGLFNPFSSLVRDNQSRSNKSSGLGMAITKQIVDLMDGQIFIDSVPGQGTRIEVVLPFAGEDVELQQVRNKNAVDQLRVLLIDESEATRNQAKQMLKSFGYEVHSMVNAPAALRFIGGKPALDLAVVDWNTSNDKGHEALIQSIAALPTAPRILFVTPFGYESIPLGVRKQIHGHLPKPYNASVLFDTIANLFAQQIPPGPAVKQDGLFSGLQLLLLDDNPVNNMIAKGLFEQEGASTICFSSGKKALAYLQEQAPDLVISDLDMPEMDGYGFVKALREMDLNIPVISLTANTDDESRRRLQTSGFDHNLTKPLTQEKIQKIAELLSLERSQSPNADLAEVLRSFDEGLQAQVQLLLSGLLEDAKLRRPKGCKEKLAQLKSLNPQNQPFTLFLEHLQGDLSRYRFEPLIAAIEPVIAAWEVSPDDHRLPT